MKSIDFGDSILDGFRIEQVQFLVRCADGVYRVKEQEDLQIENSNRINRA